MAGSVGKEALLSPFHIMALQQHLSSCGFIARQVPGNDRLHMAITAPRHPKDPGIDAFSCYHSIVHMIDHNTKIRDKRCTWQLHGRSRRRPAALPGAAQTP